MLYQRVIYKAKNLKIKNKTMEEYGKPVSGFAF